MEKVGELQSWAASEPLEGGGSIIRFGGELDLASADLLHGAVDQAIGEGGPILVDLAQCSFIDSTGLAALLRARGGTNGDPARNVAVCRPTLQVRRVFDVTKVTSELPVFESSEAAAAALAQGSDA